MYLEKNLFVPLLVVLCTLVVFSFGEEYSQNHQDYQQQQLNPPQNGNNGYSTPLSSSSAPFTPSHQSYHHRNHPTRSSYPTESRTVVPLLFPMIVFVGVVLLVFFAVVGSAAVIGSATSAIGRHDVGPPPHFQKYAFARELSSSAALARDVLSSEECVEKISCEMFRLAKGYKAQNWVLRALDLLPVQSNLTKRASRAIWRQSKSSRTQRSGKGNRTHCQEFQCSRVSSLVDAVKKLRAD